MIVVNVTFSGFCVAAVSFAGNVVFPPTSDDVTCAVVDQRQRYIRFGGFCLKLVIREGIKKATKKLFLGIFPI